MISVQEIATRHTNNFYLLDDTYKGLIDIKGLPKNIIFVKEDAFLAYQKLVAIYKRDLPDIENFLCGTIAKNIQSTSLIEVMNKAVEKRLDNETTVISGLYKTLGGQVDIEDLKQLILKFAYQIDPEFKKAVEKTLIKAVEGAKDQPDLEHIVKAVMAIRTYQEYQDREQILVYHADILCFMLKKHLREHSVPHPDLVQGRDKLAIEINAFEVFLEALAAKDSTKGILKDRYIFNLGGDFEGLDYLNQLQRRYNAMHKVQVCKDYKSLIESKSDGKAANTIVKEFLKKKKSKGYLSRWPKVKLSDPGKEGTTADNKLALESNFINKNAQAAHFKAYYNSENTMLTSTESTVLKPRRAVSRVQKKRMDRAHWALKTLDQLEIIGKRQAE